MIYEKFQKELINRLQTKCANGIHLELTRQLKNNSQAKIGILFKNPDTNTAPAIYLEEYYKQYQKDGNLEDIVDNILQFYNSIPLWSFDERSITDFNRVKNHITMKLINTEKNHELLDMVPYIPFEDLSIVYYCVLKVMDNEMGTMLITNQHVAEWGVDAEVLHQYALANYKGLLSTKFLSLSQQIALFLHPCDNSNPLGDACFVPEYNDHSDDFMYVLTNKLNQWGAALITCKSLMDEIADYFHEGFYILPSSVHEAVLVPDSKALPEDELALMMQEINQSELDPQEYLSGHAYHYSRDGKNSIPCFGQNLSLYHF